jgi:hypothetical protein
MSKGTPFPDSFFDSPDADPLNKTDLLSDEETDAPPPPDRGEGSRERGLDSVFAASPSMEEAPGASEHQRAILITRTARRTNGLDELNKALGSGWELMHVTLMGDSEKNAPWLAEAEADAYFSALVFVEDQDAA